MAIEPKWLVVLLCCCLGTLVPTARAQSCTYEVAAGNCEQSKSCEYTGDYEGSSATDCEAHCSDPSNNCDAFDHDTRWLRGTTTCYLFKGSGCTGDGDAVASCRSASCDNGGGAPTPVPVTPTAPSPTSECTYEVTAGNCGQSESCEHTGDYVGSAADCEAHCSDPSNSCDAFDHNTSFQGTTTLCYLFKGSGCTGDGDEAASCRSAKCDDGGGAPTPVPVTPTPVASPTAPSPTPECTYEVTAGNCGQSESCEHTGDYKGSSATDCEAHCSNPSNNCDAFHHDIWLLRGTSTCYLFKGSGCTGDGDAAVFCRSANCDGGGGAVNPTPTPVPSPTPTPTPVEPIEPIDRPSCNWRQFGDSCSVPLGPNCPWKKRDVTPNFMEIATDGRVYRRGTSGPPVPTLVKGIAYYRFTVYTPDQGAYDGMQQWIDNTRSGRGGKGEISQIIFGFPKETYRRLMTLIPQNKYQVK
jgi:hypothetical protein